MARAFLVLSGLLLALGGWSVCAQGAGALVRGRVVGRSGEPAAGLELLIRSVGEDERLGGRRGQGRVEEFRTETDADGAFEVGGLGPGAYVVRARVEPHTSEFAHLLTPEPIQSQAADDRSERLLTFSRPHLVVRLLASDGSPWPGPIRDRGHEYPGASWPTVAQTFAYACIPTGPDSFMAGSRNTGKRVAASEVVYEASGGGSWLVGAFGAGFDGGVRRVEVPGDGERIVVELRAREVGELATVTVRVRKHGQELGVSGEDEGFAVELVTRSGAVPLLGAGTHERHSPIALRMPSGTYRVVARGYPLIEPYHAGLTRARDLGAAEVELTVTAGATQEVELDLDGGGRLELQLEGGGNEAEFERVPDAFGSPRLQPSVMLLLVRPTGGEGIFRRWPGLYQDNLISSWPLGETHVSECLPTGRATVLARLRGGREVRVEVDVRAGETTKARLSF